MSIILMASAFIFALCFAARAMDDYWKKPEKHRLVYMLLGLTVGVMGYVITVTAFRIAQDSPEPSQFFVTMIVIDLLTMVVGRLGIFAADLLREYMRWVTHIS